MNVHLGLSYIEGRTTESYDSKFSEKQKPRVEVRAEIYRGFFEGVPQFYGG